MRAVCGGAAEIVEISIVGDVYLFPSSGSRVSAAFPKFPDHPGPEIGNCLEVLLIKKSSVSRQMGNGLLPSPFERRI